MVQNNKVLTVSYGTFSCTLEGFEDSFGTMKAIAEYFRDLASDDRYFGAEPPQPDADMLARIAQREIARQVEARTEPKGIVLRAAEPATDPTPAAAAVAAPVVADPVAPPVEEPPAAAPISETPAPEAMPPEAPADDMPAEPQPLAQVAEAQPEAEAEDTFAATAGAEPEQLAETEDAGIAELETVVEAAPEAPAAPAPEMAPDDAAGFFDVPVEAPVEDASEDTFEEEDAPLYEAELVEDPEIVPAADSIAAKLQRIRAVVSRNEDATGADAYDEEYEEVYTEDEHAEDASAEIQLAEDPLADAAKDLNAALELDDANESGDALDEVETAPEVDALMGAIDTGTQEDDVVQEVDVQEVEEPLTDNLDATEDTEDDTEEEPADVAPVRVLRVKRDDVVPAHETADSAAEQSGSLSAEDEEDLLRELAEVEAELKAAAADDDLADDDDDDAGNLFQEDMQGAVDDIDEEVGGEDRAAEAQATLPPAAEDNEEDLSRLMAAADEKLDDPSASSNRDTYSHLRAAVAAAEAERSAGGTVGTHTDDSPYQDDLAEVVRPRRPSVAATSARPRSSSERPAPLKLVAEQRVDIPADTENKGPVRPRRIASALPEAAESGSESGFAEYAAENGAVSLPDLLEAAAAYMSFVEGHDQFSRPQLMNKVRQLDNQEFNREDGLRSFGQLLRDGKIEKTGGGRFTASGEIGFRPDGRAVG